MSMRKCVYITGTSSETRTFSNNRREIKNTITQSSMIKEKTVLTVIKHLKANALQLNEAQNPLE